MAREEQQAMMDPYLGEQKLSSAVGQLVQRRVFFGHQSVGYDILDGIAQLAEDLAQPIEIRERESRLQDGQETPEVKGDRGTTTPGITHVRIGRNGYPEEKIKEFARIMRDGMGESVDIAFMKFCYVDTAGTLSAEGIFGAYVEEVERLEVEYPSVAFVYVTMPLTAAQPSVKNRVRALLGLPVWGREDNVERCRFNELLRLTKGYTGRLFDLAALQSTRPDGTTESFEHEGRDYEALVPDYARDSGHLNERGRRVIAETLVLFLAGLPPWGESSKDSAMPESLTRWRR